VGHLEYSKNLKSNKGYPNLTLSDFYGNADNTTFFYLHPESSFLKCTTNNKVMGLSQVPLLSRAKSIE